MLRRILVLTFASMDYGQPAFEAASVKPVGFDKMMEGQRAVSFAPGSVTMRGVTVKTILTTAYGVKDYQVSGPSWTNSDRYDVIAKAAGSAPESEVRQMLQQLLAER